MNESAWEEWPENRNDDNACDECNNAKRYTDFDIVVERESARSENQGVWRCFVEELAIQCGYCTPGMIMSAEALLRKNPDPTEDEIRLALSGNICRCSGYVQIVRAVKRAAKERREAQCRA